MKNLAAIFLLSTAINANASVIYTWHSSTYEFIPTEHAAVTAADIFNMNLSWTLSDAAVERGYIQMISDGPGTITTPQDIIDFSMSAVSLDGSHSYSWDKSDLPIDFSHPTEWDEAFDTNLGISNGVNGGPRMNDIWWFMKRDGYQFYNWGNQFEITGPEGYGGFGYLINGSWTHAEVPEPSSLLLLLAGLTGIAVQRRKAWKTR